VENNVEGEEANRIGLPVNIFFIQDMIIEIVEYFRNKKTNYKKIGISYANIKKFDSHKGRCIGDSLFRIFII